MSKSADNLSKIDEATTKRNSKYQIIFKESQRSHRTGNQLSLNHLFSLNRDHNISLNHIVSLNQDNNFENKSIRTEPLYDVESQLRSSPIIFDRNHEKVCMGISINNFNNENNNKNINKTNERKSNFLEIPNNQSPLKPRESVNSAKSSLYNCLICCDRNPNAVFMDCGHGGIFINFSIK